MSVDAWVIATVDHLRTLLAAGGHIPGGASKAAKFIDIQPGGHPPPSSGDFYIAVDETGTSNKLVEGGLNEVYRVDVWISKRTGVFAPDRFGEMYRNNARSLRKLQRAVIVAIHDNNDLRLAVNVELGAPDENLGDICINPLWFQNCDPTRPAGPEWCGAMPNENHGFLVRQIHFAGGRRTQHMDVAG